ncbi:MAG: PASTA domain-containing protein, partial [Oscillospiraceae bacterium]|nr:PASTA domain-containing protein [Oscillospiraceae bacterium]
ESTEKTVKVPAVIGLSGQQASKALINKNLNIKISGIDISDGNTKAISQTPAAGEQVPPGTVVTVEFVSTEEMA